MKRDKWMKNYDTKKKKKNFVAQSACDVASIIYGVIDSWTNQKKWTNSLLIINKNKINHIIFKIIFFGR